MDDVMAVQIYNAVSPLLPFAVGAPFAIAALLMIYRTFRDWF